MTSTLPFVMSVFGTRPEAIKMAPVVRALAARTGAVRSYICVTAQHRDLLDQALGLFELRPDIDLNVMQPEQELGELLAAVVRGVGAVLREVRPAWVVVQGDTTSAVAASLAASYQGIPIAHVEAGLRSGNLRAPWPEELNRRLIGGLAALHFAPTPGARDHLLREGVPGDRIHVTGNTIVDALRLMTERLDRDTVLRGGLERQFSFLDASRRLVLVTAHRRESFGAGIERVCAAIRALLCRHDDIEVVYPVHPNPQVREPVERLLGPVGPGDHRVARASAALGRLHLIEPLEYLPFVHLMRRAELLLTDSGGIQEEATALGRPALVLRDVTERPEAVAAGWVRLVGTNVERIVAESHRVLGAALAGDGRNVFGDGRAGERIADLLVRALPSRP